MQAETVYGKLNAIFGKSVEIEQDERSLGIARQQVDYYCTIDKLCGILEAHLDMQTLELQAFVAAHSQQAPVADDAVRMLGTAAARLGCENAFAREIAQALARTEWQIASMQREKAYLAAALADRRKCAYMEFEAVGAALKRRYYIYIYQKAAAALRKRILQLKADETQKTLEIAQSAAKTRVQQ